MNLLSASLRLCRSNLFRGFSRISRAHSSLRALRLCVALLLLTFAAGGQIPTPKDSLGFTPGDDRKLASWAQVVDYFKKLDTASDRMIFEEIGKTTMGAPFVYATVSSPENLRNLAKYRDINDKLADPRKIKSNDAAAKRLVAEGKTIVLITFGIHSTEVGSTLSSMLIAHELVSSNDARINDILDNTIILLVPSLNPDGVDIVKNWYDKTLGTPYEGTEPPELYHKYVGHDNNRDWYAFTQVETQLTVDKILNVWHPQIVHDVHQQGRNGSRLFLPPYMQPVEPNVPKQIVEGYTELGNSIAKAMRDKGYQGITTNSTYDAWTPARAYSHYHGGVRILSETASAKLATPVTVKWEDIRAGADDGYDPKVESANFGPVWKGGEWKLRNITDYMTTAAFSLLTHAADNRTRWLSRFYEIGKEAVRPRKDGEVLGYRVSVPSFQTDKLYSAKQLIRILKRGGVEVDQRMTINLDALAFDAIIDISQPYASFAKALFEKQSYPDLKDEKGNPIAPYDVTGHTLPLLMGVDVRPITTRINRKGSLVADDQEQGSSCGCTDPQSLAVGLYQSSTTSMDEGWTRWLLERARTGSSTRVSCTLACMPLDSVSDKSIRTGLDDSTKVLIFPDQSPNQILNGHAKGSMPDEYTGGVGKEGVENLKKFVEAGGTLVFLNRASNFAIEQFNLPVKDVTKGLTRKDFYIPGSILRTELDLSHPIAKGMPQQSIAWFENSPVFELIEPPLVSGGLPQASSAPQASGSAKPPLTSGGPIRVIAHYPSDPKQILLSGWALGAEKIAGKAALVEFTIGKGKIVLFGFRPQYRGQSLATFPLLFNSISH